jgi:hypothetical protein
MNNDLVNGLLQLILYLTPNVATCNHCLMSKQDRTRNSNLSQFPQNSLHKGQSMSFFQSMAHHVNIQLQDAGPKFKTYPPQFVPDWFVCKSATVDDNRFPLSSSK